MESDVITIQDVFSFIFTTGGKESANITGRLQATGLRPKVVERIRAAGIELPTKLFQPSGLTPGPTPRNETWSMATLGEAAGGPESADRAKILANIARPGGGPRGSPLSQPSSSPGASSPSPGAL